MVHFEAERKSMVARQIAGRGIRDASVLAAVGKVPREAFLDADHQEFAYQDRPLPIGGGQTMSQPYIVALMCEAAAIRPGDRVLEIGTGSGYGAAVLAELGATVFTVERNDALAARARQRLAQAGYHGVQVITADGTLGLAEAAPFDAILVTASGPQVPAALLDQLGTGGRLVMPVGDADAVQRLVCVRRTGAGAFEQDDLGAVRFVPLIGEQGWPAADPEGEEPSTP